MGNATNREQWAGQERLRFVERRAWWRGVVNRRDLVELFGISAAQASGDLQAYLELNPGSMHYSLSRKRYEAVAEMRCVLHEPRLRDVLGAAWVGGLGSAEVPADRVVLPTREAEPQVDRRVFLSVAEERVLGVRYWSVHRSRVSFREIAPRAFAHDGYRWHVRAWCFENEDFRDFVLSRIESAEWPERSFQPPLVDEDWETMEVVAVRPSSRLSREQQKAVARDYGMKRGKLRLEVRKALKSYWLAYLRLPDEEKPLPSHLELAK
ncbi:MAG: WYL domain-containing protein [Verrucomicrobiota bacterium]